MNQSDAADIRAEIVETFQSLERDDVYEYLLELGKKLPTFPDGLKKPEYMIEGCSSRVWIVFENNGLKMISDSVLVSGLLYMMMVDWYAQSRTLLADELDISHYLSMTRRNGLEQIKKRFVV
jgi:cysteine desulfuration protein SufE